MVNKVSMRQQHSKKTKKRRGSKSQVRKNTHKRPKSRTRSKSSRRSKSRTRSKSSRRNSKKGGAIRLPSEYFGKNSSRYTTANKNSHTGTSFPGTNLSYSI